MSDLNANDAYPGQSDAPRGSLSQESTASDLRPRSEGRDKKAKRKPKGPLQSFLWFVRDVVVILAIAIVVSFVVKTFFVRSFFIPSESMMNTLHIDDRVIVNELVPDIMPVQHGDVVVFKDPGGWLTATVHPSKGPIGDGIDWALSLVGITSPDNDQHLIKRVIGLPGDTVKCCTPEGLLTINGVAVKEPYVRLPEGVTRVSEVDFSVTVPKNSLWVMGDNRYNSKDSRFNIEKPGHGFVATSDVVGRAFVLSWPIKNWSWLSNYSETFVDVPKVAVDPSANTTPTVSPR